MQLKIAIIGPAYPFRGGIAHYTTFLYKYLKKRHEVRFFSFKRQYPKWLFPGRTDMDPSQETIDEPGVERILDSINPVTWAKTAWKIIKWHPDIVIIPWWVSFWAPQFLTISLFVKICCQAKILFICHNVVAHESLWMDRVLTGMVLRRGDLFIVHSEEDRQNLAVMLPGAQVRKCFHPIYDGFSSRENGNGSSFNKIRAKYGLNGPVLLFFGFVRRYKGLEYLLKAMPKIIETLHRVVLVVAGEFWNDKAEYEGLIQNLGIGSRIILVDDYIPNEAVRDYFGASDLVVQPYLSATGSGVVQMAFGFDRPVVATTVGSLSEIVEHCKTGFLVPPADSSAIADAVIRFFQQDCSVEFRNNIRKQKYRFSWDHLVDAITEEFYLHESCQKQN
jgi:glycosyltransferase involved in cell wall biosynthesis